jgi:hypothetical protein
VLFGVLAARSPGLFLLTILEVLWEASVTIYLIVKGFRPSPILPDDPCSVPQTVLIGGQLLSRGDRSA